MKLLLLFLAISLLISCKKQEPDNEVKDVIGTYNGIRINKTYNSLGTLTSDTSNISIEVKAGKKSNEIELICAPSYVITPIFYYSVTQFYSYEKSHAPTISFLNDTLTFYHKPGLGPNSTSFKAYK